MPAIISYVWAFAYNPSTVAKSKTFRMFTSDFGSPSYVRQLTPPACRLDNGVYERAAHRVQTATSAIHTKFCDETLLCQSAFPRRVKVTRKGVGKIAIPPVPLTDCVTFFCRAYSVFAPVQLACKCIGVVLTNLPAQSRHRFRHGVGDGFGERGANACFTPKPVFECSHPVAVTKALKQIGTDFLFFARKFPRAMKAVRRFNIVRTVSTTSCSSRYIFGVAGIEVLAFLDVATYKDPEVDFFLCWRFGLRCFVVRFGCPRTRHCVIPSWGYK